jgi:hypothetical protein
MLFSCDKKEKNQKLISKEESSYVIKLHDQTFKVNPDLGARIISFQQSGNEIIGEGGSTFWTSPQSQWGWPPVKEHDNLPYSIQDSGDSLILTSKPDSAMGLQIIKTFIPNMNDTSILVRYTILNTSNASKSVAPWENTRTFKKAIMLYPKGRSDSTASAEPFSNPVLKETDGIRWFKFDSTRIGGKEMGKLFADGSEGWIANVYNGYILVKKIPDLSQEQIAPGEGEIEIWADLGSNFMEMEQQGPYVKLEPGQQTSWEVKWILRKVPEMIKAEEGNMELVNYIRSLVK